VASIKIIRSQAAAIGVLEAAHTLEGGAADWLDRIARSMEALLHAPRGVAAVAGEAT